MQNDTQNPVPATDPNAVVTTSIPADVTMTPAPVVATDTTTVTEAPAVMPEATVTAGTPVAETVTETSATTFPDPEAVVMPEEKVEEPAVVNPTV